MNWENKEIHPATWDFIKSILQIVSQDDFRYSESIRRYCKNILEADGEKNYHDNQISKNKI